MYSAVLGFWPVQEFVLLVSGATRCGEVARGGRLFDWNVIVTRPTVLTEVQRRTRPNSTLSLR